MNFNFKLNSPFSLRNSIQIIFNLNTRKMQQMRRPIRPPRPRSGRGQWHSRKNNGEGVRLR